MTHRPPAVPLVTHDPYFSIWSADNCLYEGPARHWTRMPHPLTGLIRVDGKTRRFLGDCWEVRDTAAQTSLEIRPTTTVYTFEADGVRLTATFTSPLLPEDLEVLSRPVTYITLSAQSSDGAEHDVSLYFDASSQLAVGWPTDEVVFGRVQAPGMTVLRAGSQAQRVLAKKGDDLRIDWGWLYLAVPGSVPHTSVIAASEASRRRFAAEGSLPDTDDTECPRPANVRQPVLAVAMALGRVGTEPAERTLLLAYDDVYSLEYMERKLRPLWRANGGGAVELLSAAIADQPALMQRCRAFDTELMEDLRAAGGEGYAYLAALSYRQCIAAHKLAADGDGGIVFFSKENFSNGCINTVDVTYPSAPLFLLLQPALLKAQVGPIMDYAASNRWPFPFAPHDLGTYPLANGQVYGGAEENETNQMPVEECGNMLILVAALAHVEGSADFASRHWGVLTEWAEYLRRHGTDPENQLCTDDFAGHLAHNANLSIKAIMGVASYAALCEARGMAAEAAEWKDTARRMAAEWFQLADDGDHYRLAFDKPGSWSQKYNLVWDRLLGFDVFPPEVAEREAAFYRGKLNEYGLPLDNRADYTKADWEIWTALLCGNDADFRAIVDRVVRFADETPDRVPLSDWYDTRTSKHVGFQARSVVGGVFIPLLRDAGVWRKWSSRADPTMR